MRGAYLTNLALGLLLAVLSSQQSFTDAQAAAATPAAAPRPAAAPPAAATPAAAPRPAAAAPRPAAAAAPAAGGWRDGRITYYGAPEEVSKAYDPSRYVSSSPFD